MKIHPVFILTAPIIVLLSCARQHPAGRRPAPAPPPPAIARTLFLRNCAHCHGADAHGDDGPDLHGLDWTKDQIADRIRQGKAGQMTAFAGKLTPEEIQALTAYVQSLN